MGPGETFPREELLPDIGCATGSLSCLSARNAWTLPGPLGDGVAALGGFVGKVDEVRVWGVALGGSQLAEFAYLSGNAVRITHPAAAALSGYYRFNEGNGTTVHDWSAHRRDLALRRDYAVIPARRLPNARAGGGYEVVGEDVIAFYGVGLEEVFAGLGGGSVDNNHGQQRRRHLLSGDGGGGGEGVGGEADRRDAGVRTSAHGGDSFYGLLPENATGGGDKDSFYGLLPGNASDGGAEDSFYGFYGVDTTRGEDPRLLGLLGGSSYGGAGAATGGGATKEEGEDEDERVPLLPSAWMEGVGRNGCCASGCQLCEGGFNAARRSVGGRVRVAGA